MKGFLNFHCEFHQVKSHGDPSLAAYR
jgi:hypothetical protein